jgi:hypothetical protein
MTMFLLRGLFQIFFCVCFVFHVFGFFPGLFVYFLLLKCLLTDM